MSEDSYLLPASLSNMLISESQHDSTLYLGPCIAVSKFHEKNMVHIVL